MLCNRVLPTVPLRQWVLSLPKALRHPLAYNGELCRAVARVAMQVIFQFLRQLGLRSTHMVHSGAMVAA